MASSTFRVPINHRNPPIIFPDPVQQSSPHPILLTLLTAVTVIFISACLFWHYQPHQRRLKMPRQLSQKVIDLCTSNTSVSSELASNPSLTPGKAAHKLFKELEVPGVIESKPHAHKHDDHIASQEELEKASRCGKFGNTRPSELFLRMFHDALLPLDSDPLVGMVSPSLIGTTGVVPLTIIGPLPDICRHMSNLIARAETEVFLATNYWMDSDATRLITDSLHELSRRMQAQGRKAVVKILYDRGALKQVITNHYKVQPSEYTGKAGKVNLPHPDEVPGLDMEVVNYHRPALGTFHSKFLVVDRKHGVICSNNIQDNDNLEMASCLEGPIVDSLYDTCLLSWHEALEPSLPCLSETNAAPLHSFNDPTFTNMFDANGALKVPDPGDNRTPNGVVTDAEHARLALHAPGDPHYDPNIAAEVTRMRSILTSQHPSETQLSLITAHLNQANHQIDTKASAPDPVPGHEMLTYIPLAVHEPVPMALVNRKPWGTPNHSCTFTPQNEAWLSGLRNAKHTVFAQTPDLNADPLLPEIIAAVKRGVQVTYIVCLGYNDAGELLPFQGGHNEGVASKLYTQLPSESDRARLHIAYYVGKDQSHPIHNQFKKRSCHIKLMIIDDQVAIQGNGNLDTQSYYHSQETNVMIDSKEICGKWMEGLRRNQGTWEFGMASQVDGIWRDGEGREAEGAIGKDAGRFSWMKGVTGAIARVRGAGGF